MGTEKKVETAALVKAKRTMPTAAERVARLEAELAAAKAKAEAKANKAKAENIERRAKLIVKRDALNTMISNLDTVIGEVEPAPDNVKQLKTS